MVLEALSDADREVVRRCVLISARGDLFPEEEFHSLFGMARVELLDLANHWPPDDSPGTPGALAIHNSLNNVLGYPHGKAESLGDLVGATDGSIRRIFDAWRDRGDLPSRVIAARSFGRVTCAVQNLPGDPHPRAAADLVMREHALRPLGAHWRQVSCDMALAICVHLLEQDLAYGAPCMSPVRARALAQELLLAPQEPRHFFTNASWGDSESDLPNRGGNWHFTPASDATLNAGVVCVGTASSMILWVEDED